MPNFHLIYRAPCRAKGRTSASTHTICSSKDSWRKSSHMVSVEFRFVTLKALRNHNQGYWLTFWERSILFLLLLEKQTNMRCSYYCFEYVRCYRLTLQDKESDCDAHWSIFKVYFCRHYINGVKWLNMVRSDHPCIKLQIITSAGL